MRAVVVPENATGELYTGIIASAVPAMIEAAIASSSGIGTHVVFMSKMRLTEATAEAVATYRGMRDQAPLRPVFLPEPPGAEPGGQEDPAQFAKECDRLDALTALAENRDDPEPGAPLVLYTTPEAFFSPLPARDELAARELRLRPGMVFGFEKLKNILGGELDYDSEPLCEYPGQYAIRGGLIDVYPLNARSPLRIDFFGDEIDSIRTYDPTTQRSLESVPAAIVAARINPKMGRREGNILGYFGDTVQWIFVEPDDLEESHRAPFHAFEQIEGKLPTFQNIFTNGRLGTDRVVALSELEPTRPLFASFPRRRELPFEALAPYRIQPLSAGVGADRVEAEQAARAEFIQLLQEWQQSGDQVVVVLPDTAAEDRFDKFLKSQATLRSFKPQVLRGALQSGFILERQPAAPGFPFALPDPLAHDGRTILVSDSEIFGRFRVAPHTIRRRALPHRSHVDQLLDFSELIEGDHLVHMSHGVCIFRGISVEEFDGRREEAIRLEFADKITLHLPLHDSHLLSRYVGFSKVTPKLGKPGTQQWARARRSAEKATLDFAAELLNLQAKRSQLSGIQFDPNTEWQLEFEGAFPYQETPDQARSIEEVRVDMEKAQPMDRLICGDVGFGKTEVAIRAAFKAVMSGYQVAILVPTTVLAQQHFDTFRERMTGYPVTVEMLSRFRTRAEQTAILNQVREGRIDILIGTHRLLSSDVKIPRLGLLVIDEEHRFGVRHKEKFKQFREEVDVLTMSATPIPRTLYLALMGARDLSVIETPPADRLPIQTLVRSYDPDLVKRAIQEELNRGGQVFYLHNRVQTIDAVAQRITQLVPDARIAVGHGQMTERRLEKIMTDFVAGRYDILVCTTIIENGLDIPNCNTLIIEGADRFGLSQLYQLRGRVGRFKRQAYAYLLLHRHDRLVDIARKRLSALRQHNQLGAGFRIAMRDLELRGAGNLLGTQQSGHIAAIGFDLYCQLLRQSISRLKGETHAARIRARVMLDFVTVGGAAHAASEGATRDFDVLVQAQLEGKGTDRIEALIPYSYMPETRQRIDVYRRLALALTVEEVDSVGKELEDRFGALPNELKYLLSLTRIRVLAEDAGILSVETQSNILKCLRSSGIPNDYIKFGNRFPRLTGKSAILRLQEVEQFLKRHRPTAL